jgi:hypothetical protein
MELCNYRKNLSSVYEALMNGQMGKGFYLWGNTLHLVRKAIIEQDAVRYDVEPIACGCHITTIPSTNTTVAICEMSEDRLVSSDPRSARTTEHKDVDTTGIPEQLDITRYKVIPKTTHILTGGDLSEAVDKIHAYVGSDDRLLPGLYIAAVPPKKHATGAYEGSPTILGKTGWSTLTPRSETRDSDSGWREYGEIYRFRPRPLIKSGLLKNHGTEAEIAARSRLIYEIAAANAVADDQTYDQEETKTELSVEVLASNKHVSAAVAKTATNSSGTYKKKVLATSVASNLGTGDANSNAITPAIDNIPCVTSGAAEATERLRGDACMEADCNTAASVLPGVRTTTVVPGTVVRSVVNRPGRVEILRQGAAFASETPTPVASADGNSTTTQVISDAACIVLDTTKVVGYLDNKAHTEADHNTAVNDVSGVKTVTAAHSTTTEYNEENKIARTETRELEVSLEEDPDVKDHEHWLTTTSLTATEPAITINQYQSGQRYTEPNEASLTNCATGVLPELKIGMKWNRSDRAKRRTQELVQRANRYRRHKIQILNADELRDALRSRPNDARNYSRAQRCIVYGGTNVRCCHEKVIKPIQGYG